MLEQGGVDLVRRLERQRMTGTLDHRSLAPGMAAASSTASGVSRSAPAASTSVGTVIRPRSATRVPLTVRTLCGAGARAAAQHSQTLYGMTASIPGLKTVCPSNPFDAKGLLLASIRDDNPVVCCEPKSLVFKKAAVVREGSDVTLVGMGATVPVALDAAEQLTADSTSAEVVDLRTLAPFDQDAILASLTKTGRLVVIDETTPHCGMASEIAALCVDRGFDLLNAPVKQVTAPHIPVPFSPVLEDAYQPSAEKVIAAVRELG